MNKAHIVFIVLVCVGLLSACATTKWETSSNVTIGWDAPTSLSDGTPIPEDMALKYNVYIDRDTDNTHDDRELLTKEPISETSYTIDSIEYKGKYFIGIQTIAIKDMDGKLYDEPKKSRIAWSSNEADTKGGSFGINLD